ncbi:MAG: VOC family protein [Pseudomonadota bacterium]
MPEIGGKTLPALGQVGIVVKDLDRAVSHYRDVFGLGPFQIFEFAPEKHWLKGKPLPIKLKIALAAMGSVHLELIQPLEGDAPHRWFLDKNGEGVQHLGFYIEDYDGWLDHLKKHGIGVLMAAETFVEGMGDVRAAYVESDDPGGVLFELIEVTPRS